MYLLKIITVIIFGCLFTSSSFSQQSVVVSDLESWSSVSLEKKLSEKFSVELGQHLRLKKNSSQLHNTFTQLSLEYKLAKGLKLGGGYRFIFDRDNSDFEKFRRFQADLKYKHEIKRFELNYRLRAQNKKQRGLEDSETALTENALRLKVGVGYNIKNWKWDPAFSTEIFRSKIGENAGEFSKIRFTLSTQYKVKKLGVFSPFYRFEREPGNYLPKNTYIIGFNFKFKL